MDQIARLRTHQRNVDRYQNLLKTQLSETELQFVEKRLSEERFAMAKLQFMSPHAPIRAISTERRKSL